MHTRIHQPKNTPGGNKGSSENLTQYLEKEDKGEGRLRDAGFFDQSAESISAETAREALDANWGKLKSQDAKFFMITLSPSQRELSFVGEEKDAWIDYTRKVMDRYAEEMNRTYDDGRKMIGNDLLYFAKIEHERTYKFGDPRFKEAMTLNKEIRNTIYTKEREYVLSIQAIDRNKELSEIKRETLKKDLMHSHSRELSELKDKLIRNSQGTVIEEGAKKDGNNLHIHVIVSRNDITKTKSLSPLANHRGSKNILNGKEVQVGFNRDRFVQSTENLFDSHFGYNRDVKERYTYHRDNVHHYKSWIRGAKLTHLAIRDPEAFAKAMAQRALTELIKDQTLKKALGYATSSPRQISSKIINNLERKGIEAAMKAMGASAYSNPATAAIQAAKSIILTTARSIGRAASTGL